MNKSRMQRLAGLLVEARAEEGQEKIAELFHDIDLLFFHLSGRPGDTRHSPMDLVAAELGGIEGQVLAKLSADDLDEIESALDSAELLAEDFLDGLREIRRRARALAL